MTLKQPTCVTIYSNYRGLQESTIFVFTEELAPGPSDVSAQNEYTR